MAERPASPAAMTNCRRCMGLKVSPARAKRWRAVAEPLYGGVPVVIDGQIAGGVGVGGGTGEQDAEIARAGIAALLAQIEEPKAGGQE